METDFLVIGSGVAGLTYAIKNGKTFFRRKKILIITKANAEETNTKYAQGGIAGVWDEEKDSFEMHVEDTLIAGDGLCNEKAVEIVVKEGVERIKKLLNTVQSSIRKPPANIRLGVKAGIALFASCIIKTLPAGK